MNGSVTCGRNRAEARIEVSPLKRCQEVAKRLTIHPEQCTGCRLCEIVCSVRKDGASDPSRSRIRILTNEGGDAFSPVVCQHCEDPLCAAVCPVNAVQRDETGCIASDAQRCVSCKACLAICPRWGIAFREKPMRCDLCNGDPACVKACETGAIRYEERDRYQHEMRYAAARKWMGE